MFKVISKEKFVQEDGSSAHACFGVVPAIRSAWAIHDSLMEAGMKTEIVEIDVEWSEMVNFVNGLQDDDEWLARREDERLASRFD